MHAAIRTGLIGAVLLLTAPVVALAQGDRNSSVNILRGESATPHITARAVPTMAPPNVVIGGRRLWQVDQATGRVSVCELVGTSTVGSRRIRCFARRSPLL